MKIEECPLDPCLEDEKAVTEGEGELDNFLLSGDVCKDIPHIVEEIKKEFKELKDYPNLLISKEGYFIDAVYDKFKDSSSRVIKRIYALNETEEPVSFVIKRENEYIIARFYLYLGKKYMFIFYKDKKELKKQFKQIDVYYPIGAYNLEKTMSGYILTKLKITEELPPILNEKLMEQLRKDMKSFFDKKDFYKKNNLTFKRGVLLYGPPGNGKTAFIKDLMKSNIGIYSIVIDVSDGFNKSINDFLKTVLDKKRKILIFEDVEGVDRYTRSAFLNFLDGIDSMENTFIIATTNNIGKVDPALLNRPSRFDRSYYINVPNDETREKLLKRFFPELSDEELKHYGGLTKGFSGAYFKELYIFKNLQECSIKEAIDNLKKQLELYKNYDKGYIG
jgi:hypothetical protein